MKHFGIITHYDVHNHGALLQLTALIRVLKNFNIRAQALRFDKNYDFMGPSIKAKYDISIKSLGIYLSYFKEKGLRCMLYNYNKYRTLNEYKLKEDLIGNYYTNYSNLDAVIIGSDEVFALHTGPTPVFFGYCLPTEKVLSYAGSFGPTTITDLDTLHTKAFVRSGLESMDAITVRDQNSATIVKSLIGINPPIVVDPVLLYGFKQEIALMNTPLKENYLLIYAYDNRMNDFNEVEAIQKYAKSNNLKTVSAGFYHSWCDININTDPINLLSYFKYATAVITDTFHGCVMSLITNASFIVKIRESNYLKLKNLLREYDLEYRLFEKWEHIEKTIASTIDYSVVNEEINERRRRSMCELTNMLRKL